MDSANIYLYGCLEANFIENNIYQCFKCKENFILIINDNICRKTSDINISNYCLEVIYIADLLNPIYSCNKCHNETVLISDLNNIGNCYERADNLVYCLKGKIYDNGDILY